MHDDISKFEVTNQIRTRTVANSCLPVIAREPSDLHINHSWI